MADNPFKSGKERSITFSKEDYDDAAELVDAVKGLNRSVASLNHALIKLQDKIAHQCVNTKTDNHVDRETKTLH